MTHVVHWLLHLGLLKITYDMIPLLCASIPISSDRLVRCDNHIYRDVVCTDGYLFRGHHLFSQGQSNEEGPWAGAGRGEGRVRREETVIVALAVSEA